jgi:hypothetical protein
LVEHRVTGLLFRSGEVAPLERQLTLLSRDPSLSRLLGQAGRHEILQHYSGVGMARAYAALYEKIVTRPNGSQPATDPIRAAAQV